MTEPTNDHDRPEATRMGAIPPRPPLPGGSLAGNGQPPAGYGQPPAGYGQPPAGYGQPPAGYGHVPQAPPMLTGAFGGPPVPPGVNGSGFAGGTGAPEAGRGQPKKKWMLPVLAVLAGLVIAGTSVALTLWLTSPSGVTADPSPTPSVTAEASPEPTDPPTPTKTPTPKPTTTATPQPTITVKPSPQPSASAPAQPRTGDAPTVPDRSSVSVSASTVGGAIESVLNEYSRWDASGELWLLIPDTEANTYAYLAFRFLLTDLKTATIFGVDNAVAQEYWSSVSEYEQKLLTQQPLGKNVTIDDGKMYFHYDGTTGEGVYEKR